MLPTVCSYVSYFHPFFLLAPHCFVGVTYFVVHVTSPALHENNSVNPFPLSAILPTFVILSVPHTEKMNTRSFKYRKVCLLAAGIILFALLACLFDHIGRYNFTYLEQWQTFIYQSDYITRTLAQPGGCIRLITAFILQFFGHPLAGTLFTALLLTLIALLMNDILRRWSGGTVTFPLVLFPVLSLFLLHFEAWYQYTGTVALLLMLLLLRLHLCFRHFFLKTGYAVVSTVVLFIVAGPIAFLYGCLLLVMELYYLQLRSLWFLFMPLLAYVSALLSMRWGYAGELKHVLLPYGYFMLRLSPGFIVYLPWVLTAAVFVLTALFARIKLPKVWMKALLAVALLTGVVKFAATGIEQAVDHKYETFKELNYYIYHNDWEKIVTKCGTIPMNNLLYQNCLNLALAEQGVLADLLFREPCYDIRTIYALGEKNPHIYALLSDVYFSMGHIALSQRYAFEGNGSLGNFSPRLLKRLVQTNLVYGCYGVAAKYLEVLEHTLYYKEWARAHKRFLWDDKAVEADPLLGSKRKCLFPDNRFSATKGLDDDLKQIILQNPEHRATIQYLGCLYLLSKDINRFKETLELFYGTPALPEGVLPIGFQEGVVLFSGGQQEVFDRYHIPESAVNRFKAFMRQPRNDRQNLWYFLRYVK